MSNNQKTFPKSVQPGIPKLSELKHGWKRYNLGEIFDEIKRPANIQDDEKYRLVTVRRARGGLTPRSELYGREISVKSQFHIRSGDFLISKRQIVHGACAIVTDELDGAIVSNEYSVLRCKDELQLDYLSQLFHSVYIQQTFFHSSIGVHIEKMIFKLPDWFKWPVNLPPLSEQQKIAAYLTSVDTKIEQLGNKKDLLEQYKKGMMQKLFSQELRFKDEQGNDFSDWAEKQLDAVTTVITKGTTPTSVGFSFESDGVNFIKAESLGERYNIIDSKMAKISPECHDALRRSQIEDGDILFSIAGTLGRSAIANKEALPANTNQAISIIRLNNKELSPFVNYFLNSSAIRKRIKQILAVGALPNLNLEQVGQFKIQLPSFAEQQKIANFLSSIDNKIDLIATELEQAQTFKKGLLQQMFI